MTPYCLLITAFASTAAITPPAEDTRERVGQIFIVGNTRTNQSIIINRVPVYPGQILDRKALLTAEQNLERTGRFQVDPANGIRPTVTIIEGEGTFKDVLITVQERRMTRFSQSIYKFARPRIDAVPWPLTLDWRFSLLDYALDWLP